MERWVERTNIRTNEEGNKEDGQFLCCPVIAKSLGPIFGPGDVTVATRFTVLVPVNVTSIGRDRRGVGHVGHQGQEHQEQGQVQVGHRGEVKQIWRNNVVKGNEEGEAVFS